MAGKVRVSPGVTKGSSGAKNVNPVFAAATGFAKYLGNAAREIRDIPTAIGTSIYEKDSMETKKQLKEAAAAITAGEKGTSAFSYNADGYARHNKKRK